MPPATRLDDQQKHTVGVLVFDGYETAAREAIARL
jgi:hypothetical protein